jgi:DNA-binding transcriptional ArsR family regulator
MLKRPRLKGHLTLFPLSPTRWGVSGGIDELSRIELRNERAIDAFTRLLPLLDGRHEGERLVSRLAEQGLSRPAVEAILRYLEQAGLLEEADDHGLAPEEVTEQAEQIRFFARFTSEGGAKFQALLRRSRVAVVDGSSGRLARRLAEALLAAGVGEVEVLPAEAPPPAAQEADEAAIAYDAGAREPAARAHPWRERVAQRLPDLIVVSQQAHDPVLLETMDEFAKQTRVAWLLVRSLSAREGWVGPLFVPFDTASYLSLEARVQANLPFADDYRALGGYLRDRGRSAAAGGGLEPTLRVLAGIAATEAVKFLSGFEVARLAGRFLTIHFGTWTTELHDVLRLPHLERPAGAGPLPFPWQGGEAG